MGTQAAQAEEEDVIYARWYRIFTDTGGALWGFALLAVLFVLWTIYVARRDAQP